MTMKINEDCIACGACIADCPSGAISEGDTIYVIDAEICVECVGHYDSPQCIEVCPIDDCIVKT